VTQIPAAPTPPRPNTPKTSQPELAAPPIVPLTPLKIALPRMTRVLDATHLDRGDGKEQLMEEFADSGAHRLDLFCRDVNRGLDRLLTVLRRRGVQVVLDAAAADRQKRRAGRAYVLYTDDLSAKDWTDALMAASSIDRQAEQKRTGDGVLDQLTLMPLVASDQKELEKLIGIDPTSARSKSASAADSVNRPASASAKPQKTLFVAHRGTPATKEGRQHFETRQDRIAGGISVMLIFRHRE
jgi:hypothetical protein